MYAELFVSIAAICVHLKQDLCKKFNYTQYGLPNSINDNDEISAEETARSLLDIVGGAACYQHTELFVCSLAFPECVGTRTIKPCREFCEGKTSKIVKHFLEIILCL